MAQVSLPYTLQAGQPENVNNLVANLNALVAGVNTIDTAQLASGAVTTAKIAASNVDYTTLAPAPFCEIGRSTSQSINNNSATTLNADTTNTDNGVATTGTAMADLTNDRVYARRTGLYLLTSRVSWAASSSGWRRFHVEDNGGTIRAANISAGWSSIVSTWQSVGQLCSLSSGDYVLAKVYQNSGGSLDVEWGWLQLIYLGKAS